MLNYYFSETLNSFKRAKLSTVIIVITTSVAITLSAFSIMIVLLSNAFSEEVKSRAEMSLFLKDSLSVAKADSIKKVLAADWYVGEVKYLSKEEAESNFIKETGEDFKAVLESNPLPASFVLKFKPDLVNENNFESLVDRYKNIDGIDDILFDYGTVLQILKFIKSIRNFIYLGAFLMICLSIYLVYSNNKLQLNARKELFDTMKLVGAKVFTIKFPLILYGILVGVISSILCMAVYILTLNLIQRFYESFKITEWMIMFNLVILILGVAFGLIGSLLATRKINLNV
jgi:cell division transport system permease protein